MHPAGETPAAEKKGKPKPMSKRISTNISQCSAKMTEILSWQAKLDENKPGLILVFINQAKSWVHLLGI